MYVCVGVCVFCVCDCFSVRCCFVCVPVIHVLSLGCSNPISISCSCVLSFSMFDVVCVFVLFVGCVSVLCSVLCLCLL